MYVNLPTYGSVIILKAKALKGSSSLHFLTISLLSFKSTPFTLSTSLGAHTAELDVQWQPATNSYDRNPTNSRASGSVLVEANLQLEWDEDTQVLVDKDGEPASFPLD